MKKEAPAHYTVLWKIMADERLSAAAKCVATVLLLQFRNHKTGQCNPSYGEVAKRVGRKRRSVIDAFNELKAFGWIGWEGTKGGTPSNTNQIQFFLDPEPVQSAAPVQDVTLVRQNAKTGAVPCTEPVQHTAHEPSKNHLNHKRASAVRGHQGRGGLGVHASPFRSTSDSPREKRAPDFVGTDGRCGLSKEDRTFDRPARRRETGGTSQA